MRFPPAFLDEIRARLPVSDVVGRRVKLKRQGKEYAGLSPFNAEKTPSFFVNDQKGFYHCFSSGKHGDVFTFLMETEGLSFPEAVERLAAEAGLPLPKVDAEAAAREKDKRDLQEIVELACRFFEERLQSRAGSAARGYLADRGIAPETQAAFRLGYAPGERFALRDHLANKDVPLEAMVEAGLVIAGADIPVAYDRFRDRVMFPISDQRGRVIAFGGRALSKDAQAKYLNSPETPLFQKGHILYNGARARAAAHETGRVVAVEGYVDVIAMWAAGFRTTVAPLGTALTEAQLDQLWRMADEPILCFDGDKAGRRAAWRAIDLALPVLAPGRSLRFAWLPEGQDPDDLIRAEGREAMEAVLEAAEPLADVVWTREIEVQPLETPEQRAAFEARVRGRIRDIRDETVRRHYQEDFERRLARLFAVRKARPPMRRGDRPRERGFAHRPAERLPPAMLVSESLKRSGLIARRPRRLLEREVVLVATMMNHPALLALHTEQFAEIELQAKELDALRRRILELAHDEEPLDGTRLRARLQAEGSAELVGKVDEILARTPACWQARLEAADRDAEQGWMQALTLHRKCRTLHRELKAAETALATEASERNWNWLRQVQAELARVEGEEAQLEGFGVESGRPARTL